MNLDFRSTVVRGAAVKVRPAVNTDSESASRSGVSSIGGSGIGRGSVAAGGIVCSSTTGIAVVMVTVDMSACLSQSFLLCLLAENAK